MAEFENLGAGAVPAGNKIFGEKPVPLLIVLLEVMADGRWWARPALRDRLAGRAAYDTVKGKLGKGLRRRFIRRADNPLLVADVREQMRAAVARAQEFEVLGQVKRGRLVDRQARQAQCLAAAAGVTGGLQACRYVYGITERGRARLQLHRAGWRPGPFGSWAHENGAAMDGAVRELVRFVKG